MGPKWLCSKCGGRCARTGSSFLDSVRPVQSAPFSDTAAGPTGVSSGAWRRSLGACHTSTNGGHPPGATSGLQQAPHPWTRAALWLGWPVTSLCPHRQYYWYDERGKKVKCTAPQYVDFVMSSVQKLVTDEDVFPTKYGRSLSSAPRCRVGVAANEEQAAA